MQRKFCSKKYPSIEELGIKHKRVYRNLTAAQLYEIAQEQDQRPADYHTKPY
jgi:hypothetical protein